MIPANQQIEAIKAAVVKVYPTLTIEQFVQNNGTRKKDSISNARGLYVFLRRYIAPRVGKTAIWEDIRKELNYTDHTSCIRINKALSNIISVDKVERERVENALKHVCTQLNIAYDHKMALRAELD